MNTENSAEWKKLEELLMIEAGKILTHVMMNHGSGGYSVSSESGIGEKVFLVYLERAGLVYSVLDSMTRKVKYSLTDVGIKLFRER